MGWYLLSLLCLTAVGAVQNTTRCFQCTNVRNPADCTTVTECPEGQQCMVEEFVTATGEIRYNSKCQSKQHCGVGRRNSNPDSLTMRSPNILVCVHCCDGEFCNDRGCGVTALTSPAHGPTCFNCELDGHPSNCSQVSRCNTGQVCMLTEFGQRKSDGSVFYRSDCVSPSVCHAYALVGKRKRSTFCHVCCHDDYCNDHCVDPVTPVPTTQPTTTTTTTTSTTTTTTTTARPTKDPLEFLCHRYHYNYRYDASKHLHFCYKLHYEHKTWDEANSICHHEHGTLAIIDTEAKWQFMRDRLRTDPNYRSHHSSVYIGGTLHHHDSSGVFYWPNGDYVAHAHWATGEPDGKQPCLYLNGTENYLWHDVPCGQHMQFVCTIQL